MAKPYLSDDEVFGSAAGGYLNESEVLGADPASPEKKRRSAGDIAQDVAVTAVKSAIGLPEAFVGLADIPTGGRVGKALEDVGYRPGEAQRILDSMYSEATQADKAYVQQADGFTDTIGRAIERPATIATAVGESAASMLGGAGIARGIMKVAPKVGAVVAGAAGEGALGAGQAAEQIRGDNKDGLLTPAQSAISVASGIGTGLLGFAGGKLAQKFGIADIDTVLASGKTQDLAKGFVKQVIGSGISEGVFEELPQSMQEQMWQNYATGKPVMEGVGNAGAMGMLAGAAMGAAGGGYNSIVSGLGKQEQTQPPTPPAGTEPGVTGGAQQAAQPTESEKALYTPKSLTALDRVNEIDAERSKLQSRMQELADPAYGEMFNQERDEVSGQMAKLDLEKQDITKSWPNAIQGAQTSFSTEAGSRIDGQYALMEADDLNTSHDSSLRPNPNYPQELQPRERERAASEMQIAGIVQKLDPARLGISADAATGAPIVGADGLVESGNARTIALKRVYAVPGQKAEDYKSYLKANADQFGIAQDAVDQLKKPVLVRIRQTPVNRAEFARQANASTVAQMSTGEQARADAARMDVFDDLKTDDNGDFSSSRDFIRRFMAKLPVTEQSSMIDATGSLSQSGYARIRNAVLAKAYGESPVLQRMTESMDDNLRNISKALIKVSPDIAKARQAIKEGALHDADLTPDLLSAIENISILRSEGKSVAEELAQAGMFGEKYSQETRELMDFLDKNIRSPRKMADFLKNITEALAAAGNPNQSNLFGESAPGKGDLINFAKGQQNERENATDPATAQENRGQPEDGRGNQGGNQENGNNAAAAGVQAGERVSAPAFSRSEWVAFPADTGTLGIPRAEMPQIKSTDRGAFIQFLQGKGIGYEKVELQADDIKPTQAEYSPAKTARWADTEGGGSDRSVLISSDNYVLDGHHQWMAAHITGEPIQAIRIDAPIHRLLNLTYEFPSVQKSSGATGADLEELRARADEDFQIALADLGAILRKHTGARMIREEDYPDLVPTLTRLFGAAFRKVGYDMKKAAAHVREELKKNPTLKKIANFIKRETMDKAAQAALANPQDSESGQADLFGSPVRPEKGVTADLFSQPTKGAANGQGQKTEVLNKGAAVALINGRPYDMKRDNYKPASVDSFLPSDVLDEANGYVDKYYKDRPAPALDPEDVKRAEGLLTELIDKAKLVKAEYDQKIIDIAQRTNAMGQMIAPIKGMARSVQKLIVEEQFNIGGMKDVLRSTIVVDNYAQAQAVLNEITKEFTLTRKPKNRTGNTVLSVNGVELQPEDPKIYGGYTDVLVNITMPNGVIAEIQINVPEMLSAKEAQGHKLYEAYRDAPKDSPLGREINRSMLGFYEAAFAAAQARSAAASARNAAGSLEKEIPPSGPLSKPGRANNSLPSSDNLNQLPSGNSTNQSPPNVGTNLQPSGNSSGTLIASTSDSSVSNLATSAYNDSAKGESNENGNGKSGSVGPEGKGTGAAQGSAGKRKAKSVREGTSSGDLGLFGDENAGDRTQAGQGSGQDAGREGRDSENVGSAGKRAGSGRVTGIPAGRDIPLKSGRNYQFGQDDLTYEGSWQKKATQNVEAVELVKKLESENRLATPEEQKILAKFIGWGASEIANSIFGDKLDKQLEAISQYESALEAMGSNNKLYRNNRGHYQAFMVLKAKNENLNYYSQEVYEITRDQLAAAKPDMGAKKWADLRDRLKKVMTPEEWSGASRSTQYAHYTSKPVVQSMMKMLSRMGFNGGAILEPGAGIGVFPGLMPQEMATNSVYTGIEFDPITGAILKNLFPDERILVESFIDSKLPANYYDVGFGNPPFGDIPILSDPKYKKHGFLLHDYFFAKSIDSVKPGGLVVYVTSNGTMDKRGDKARSYLAERADLVGAIRMPQTAFKKNAGTEVVTDVLVLRKKVKGENFPHAQEWLKSVPITIDGNQFSINEYFVAHPDMVLGKHSSAGSMYSKDSYTVMPTGGDIDALFDKAALSLPENIFAADRGSNAEAAKIREIDFNPKAKKEGNYYVSDAGVLMVREDGVGQRVDGKSEKDVAMLKDFVGLRDALKQAHYDQLNNGEWEASLKALQKSYQAFTKKHGQINQFTTYMQRVKVDELDEEGSPTGQKVWDEEPRYKYPLLAKLRDDPDWTLVSALEQINEDEGTIKESPFLTDRVLGKPEQKAAATPTDALLQVLNDIGHVDIAAVADRLGIDPQDAIASLGPLIYQDPASDWVMADEYLSGNVRAKLRTAKEAAKSDRRYERNVEALLSAQPADKTAADIKPQIGMPWIPEAVYEQFLQEKANLKTKVTFNERTGQWDVQLAQGFVPLEATQDWGTDKRNAADILLSALTGAPIKVTMTVGTGSDRKTVADESGTEAANAKLNQMRDAFADWLWTDKERVDSLVPAYNEKFNNIVPRKFDGSHMTLPGTSKKWKVFDHVKRGAWRIVQAGNTYLAHAVGSGKTFQMIISAMEQKRLGLVQKPMMVVPNHMLQQFAREWQDLYPAARLMVADEANFTGDNRRRFVARVATSDLDGVIITHSAFKLLDLDPEFKEKMIQQELEYLRAAYSEAGGDPDSLNIEETTNKKGEVVVKVTGSKSRDPKIKQIEKKIERMEEKLKAAMSSEGKDKNLRFDETGVDMLYVDEAHEYRKLAFTTQRQVKGIDSNGSDKSFDLWMKVQWLRENKDPKRNLVMASGTPVTNTMAELYTTQRFMAPDVLADRGLEEFDQWASMFGAESTSIEPDASGKYGPVTRFNKFVNVGELTQMFREFSDVLTSDYLASLLGDKRPKVKGGSRNISVTPKTAEYADFQENDLKPRMEASRKWKPSRDEPNNPDPIIKIIGDGRLAAIDMRFIDPSLPNNPDSKLNKMIDEIIRVYQETGDMQYKDKEGKFEPNKGATQIVFSDLGFGEGVTKNRGFNARAWFEKRLRDAGVAPGHVAFMSDNKKSTAKLKLFKDINSGRVRIVVGSSKNMGTGVNAQQRLIALHHLDAPWYPADLEQREGRIVRQGNKNPEVQLYAYATKGSYDEQMWSTLARKQFFIDQALSGDPNIREIEDLGEASQFDIAAAMVADDPRVLQLAGLRAEIDKLRRLERAHEDQRGRMRYDYNLASLHIESAQGQLQDAEKAAAVVQDLSGSNFVAEADGKKYDDRKEFGNALLAKFKELSDKLSEQTTRIGKVSGFDISYSGNSTTSNGFGSRIMLMTPDPVILTESPLSDPVGVAIRSTNVLAAVAKKPGELKQRIADAQAKMNAIEPRLNTPFQMKEMLLAKIQEADVLENEIVNSGNKLTGLEREQQIEDEWQKKTGAITPLFSRGPSGKMSLSDLEKSISGMTSVLKNAPTTKVVQSAADLPFKAPADARGAFMDGKVWMVADNIKDAEEAREVYAHETMGHYGLRGFFGPMLDKELRQIFNANQRVRKLVSEWKQRNADLISSYKAKFGMSDADIQGLATEEAMAQIAQNGEKITGIKKLVAVIQSALRAMGLNRLANALEAATDAEALTMLAKADMFVRDGTKLSGWVAGGFAPAMSRAADNTPLADRVNAILAHRAGSPKPIDAIAKAAVQMVRFDRLTGKVGEIAGRLLDRFTPEQVKAGVVADYGVPENVIDRRAMLAGHLNVQTRKAGALLDKLSALTREESRVAYLWMNNNDQQAAEYFEKQLPEKSVEALKEVKALIEKLSREAVDLGQLDPESYKRNSMEYLRRSYAKYTLNLDKGEASARASAVKILGDQYKGRGFTEEAEMSKVKAAAPEWWNRKLKAGQADKQLKGEKFLRLERHKPSGEGTTPLDGFGDRSRGKLLEVAYWPAGEPIPTKYAGWDEAGTFEVRDTKGAKIVFWRDYTAAERQSMGEIDEARFAIAKTLHGMIHDIELGRYFDWVAKNYGKLVRTPEMGDVLEGKDLGWNAGLIFTKDQWVKVPETKVTGTDVTKYGALAGRYLPAPIWNDVRQSHGQVKPFGETYAKLLRLWKMSKTALSPAVHTNNVMSNFVMADWQDVTAGHVSKALRIILAAHKRDGKALIGRAGNLAARAGIADREAAQAIMDRYQDSGGSIGTWASKELQNDQISPLLEALEQEAGLHGQSADVDVGVYSALQHLMHARFKDAFTAMSGSKPVKYVGAEGQNLLDLYQAEDDVFRLAAWLKAKEEGASDMSAGKLARKSFLDYAINAPWVQMMRNTGFPFISYTYRAIPMLLETAQKKPWKLLKLAAMAGALNALGYMLSGGDEDDERKYLPEEKSGKIWGAVPKLIRMPWNDAAGSPVFLDVRRFVPVGDVFDSGSTHSAVPILPAAMPGGPLVMLMEVLLNKSAFTGKDITLETDTMGEKIAKSFDHLWKGLMPNVVVLPGTYAFEGVTNAAKGKTDAFGREMSVAQALANTAGIKMGSYPGDVLALNARKKLQGEEMEIDHQINKLKREYQKKGLIYDEFMEKVRAQQDKKRKMIEKFQQAGR